MNAEHLLITGSTGEFGKYLFVNFLSTLPTDNKITALIRANNHRQAKKRIEELIKKPLGKRVTILSADLAEKDFGLDRETYLNLANSITAIFHSAASTKFNLTLEQARIANVKTTENIITFAQKVNNLQKFGYVGTAYIAGRQKGLIQEKVLQNKGFVNTYNQTKYEAEMLIRAYMDKLPIAIYRPGLIVARDSSRHNAALVVLNLLKQKLLPVLPGKPDDQVDIISANDAAHAIYDLFINNFKKGQTYHITSSQKAPKLSEIVALINPADNKITYTGHAERSYDENVNKLLFVTPQLELVYQKIDYFIKYLLYPKLFDNKNTAKVLKNNIIHEDVLEILKERMNDV